MTSDDLSLLVEGVTSGRGKGRGDTKARGLECTICTSRA